MSCFMLIEKITKYLFRMVHLLQKNLFYNEQLLSYFQLYGRIYNDMYTYRKINAIEDKKYLAYFKLSYKLFIIIRCSIF
jgi:hypothetical protein